MVTWLNASFKMRFRLIGGLTVRFAASEDHPDHALLLSPWPESLLAFGDAYLAALTNYAFLAHAVWMTEEAVSHIRGGA